MSSIYATPKLNNIYLV